jgi:sugar lactone lactonase YvrE
MTPSPAPAVTPEIYVVNANAGTIAGFSSYASGTNVATANFFIGGNDTVMTQPYGIALDATGNIYVGNPGGILVFAQSPAGNEAPFAQITGSMTGLNSPTGIAFDSQGRIYVVDDSLASVFVFPALPAGGGMINEPPIAVISGSNTGLSGLVFDVALDTAGRVYVTDGSTSTVAVFAPVTGTGTLNEAPVATISGSNTGVYAPYGIALDSSGKVYVNDAGANAITVYPANPVGALNEAPLGKIAGSNTGLNTAESIAVDSSGVIYAANTQYAYPYTGSITVYPANPTGTLNEAPIGTILSSNATIDFPSGIAVASTLQSYQHRKRPLTVRRP